MENAGKIKDIVYQWPQLMDNSFLHVNKPSSFRFKYYLPDLRAKVAKRGPKLLDPDDPSNNIDQKSRWFQFVDAAIDYQVGKRTKEVYDEYSRV